MIGTYPDRSVVKPRFLTIYKENREGNDYNESHRRVPATAFIYLKFFWLINMRHSSGAENLRIDQLEIQGLA